MKQTTKRILSLLLVLVLLVGFAVPVNATEQTTTEDKVTFTQVDNSAVSATFTPEAAEEAEQTPDYADTDVVRVSIVLEEKSTVAMGYSVEGIAGNADAMAYRQSLRNEQTAVTAAIEKTMGQKLDVVWNLTLAANIISANVEYRQIATIEKISGVAQVLVETQYQPDVVNTEEAADPNMATSPEQIGSTAAWAAGYTGLGSRIAVIDTGTDTDHQSFSAAGFQYSLNYYAGRNNMTLEEYMEKLNLLDAQEIADLADQLNVSIEADEAYMNPKLPFGYNYVDSNYNITHDKDSQGAHGSHVAGIATANAWIQNSDGTFSRALESVLVQGVAPDAQLMTFKVFGAKGGAYESDYMAAIEDAIVLGADSINLSLGSGSPGVSRHTTATYQAILDELTKAGAVVVISAGNSGSWVDNANNVGYLYAEDVNLHTGGSPGTYTNALNVASVNNSGTTGYYIQVGQEMVFYNETNNSGAYPNQPFTTIAGTHEYVFIDGVGTPEDWAAVGEALQGKIALCSRGTTSFYEKADAAVEAGAIGIFIYNNQAGVINMDLTDYGYTAPAASLTQADGAAIRAQSMAVTDDAGNVLYLTGTMTVSDKLAAGQSGSQWYTMSDFSSWGMPGSLELKPEITAPGGSIYSVNGMVADGTGYVVNSGTSMAAPQVTGMVALVAQYIREQGLVETTGVSARHLAQSLLMSTSVPIREEASGGNYYSIMKQGSGLANVSAAITADSYILMDEGMNAGAADGKVKVELGDDPDFEGRYTISFTLNNLTEQEKAFKLCADFFTQDYFQYYANDNYSMEELSYYMDTWTTAMPVMTAWTVDGKTLNPTGAVDGMDFNGDGVVNSADGQALLDYVVGVSKSLNALDKADLDADGDVDTHDAYLFFKELGASSAVVPAGGSVEITVEVELPESWNQLMEMAGAYGLYIEGYIYAESLTDAEGVAGTTHSIPVLGYYGNFTDSSMFEVGTYAEYLSGEEVRTPYAGSATSNAWYIVRGDSPQIKNLYAGNPIVADETYMPERNAINSENGDKIAQVSYMAIRNAAASRFVAVNETTGEVLMEKDLGAVAAAYYHVNAGSWYNLSKTVALNVKPAGIKEGDQLRLSLTLAPEYYVDAEGKVNWDALGEGASLELPLVVDNTAPKIESIHMDLLTNTLQIQASDNQYVAAVGLYNGSGTKLHTVTGAKSDIEANTSALYELDLTGVNGKKFLVQVFDYAMNVSTYLVEITLGEPEDYTGRLFAFTIGSSYQGMGNRWIEIDEDNLWFYQKKIGGTIFRPVYETDHDGIIDFCATDLKVLAAEYVGGYVYSVADDGYIYVSEMEDMGYSRRVGSVGGRKVVGMAMNYADGKMYLMHQRVGEGNFYSSHYKMIISTMDLITGEIEDLYSIYIYHPIKLTTNKNYTQLHGLAIDDNGTFYSVCYGGALNETYLYTWTNEQGLAAGTMENLHPIDDSTTGGIGQGYYGVLASLAWDHDRDVLYMAGNHTESATANNKLLILDVETGKATPASTATGGYTSNVSPSQLRLSAYGLFFVPASHYAIDTKVNPDRVELDRQQFETLPNTTVKLNASVYPWCLEDKSLTWTTSDPNVAVVDSNGNVTTVGAGVVNITATTNATPSVSASCQVNVVELENKNLSALVYAADGTPYWAEFGTDNLADWNAVSGEAPAYHSGTLMNGKLYVHDYNDLYVVDPDTFETTKMPGQINHSYGDWRWTSVAPMPALGNLGEDKLLAICVNGTYLCNYDPVKAGNGGITFWNYREAFQDDPMAVVAYAYSGLYNNRYPCHYYYFMTESGKLYRFYAYSANNGVSVSGAYTLIGETGVELFGVSDINSSANASMIYDNETGRLFLSTYTDGNENLMYVVDAQSAVTSLVGNFGQGVWPVTALHDYTRPTNLWVKIEPSTTVEVYERDSYQLKAVTLNGDSKAVTWSSSDESVVTVDENGMVTGINAGTATITATSVSTNENGSHATAVVTIQVLDLYDVDDRIHAQIKTDDGAKWVTINTTDMSYTVNAKASVFYDGGGYVGSGKVIGSDTDYSSAGGMGLAGNLRYVEPGKGFAETVGSGCSMSYAIQDATILPSYTFQATDENGEEITVTTGEMAANLNITPALWFTDVNDPEMFQRGSIPLQMYLNAYYDNLVAVTYMQTETYQGMPAPQYLVLGSDGKLNKIGLQLKYHPEDNSIEVTLTRAAYGTINHTFSSQQPTLHNCCHVSMTYNQERNGLYIGDFGDGYGDLYFVDMSALTYNWNTVKVGRIPGATGISCLYTDAELNGTAFATSAESVVAAEMNTAETRTVKADYDFSNVTVLDETPMEPMLVDENGNANIMGETEAIPWDGKPVNMAMETEETVVAPASDAETAPNEDTVTVTITTPEAANNGLTNVSWDTTKLELQNVVLNGTYTAKVEADGKLTFGYVSMAEIPAEGTIATLTFKVLKVTDSAITVEHKQINNAAGSTETIKVEFEHKNTEVRYAVEATCTTAGYTGDTYCKDCGQLIEKGKIIEALGHTFGEWSVTTPATCTEEGIETRTCACGETETRVIPAYCPTADYTDVPVDAWYHNAVDYVVENGIMKGMGENVFAPNGATTRAQLVLVLYRLAGAPSVEGMTNKFIDVPADAWFTDAAVWAANEGIIKGVNEEGTIFAPNAAATREQLVTILYRYNGAAEADAAVLDTYADANTISAWATEAFAWAVENGIIEGMTETTLAPEGTATRAQIATILMRFMELRK